MIIPPIIDAGHQLRIKLSATHLYSLNEETLRATTSVSAWSRLGENGMQLRE